MGLAKSDKTAAQEVTFCTWAKQKCVYCFQTTAAEGDNWITFIRAGEMVLGGEDKSTIWWYNVGTVGLGLFKWSIAGIFSISTV